MVNPKSLANLKQNKDKGRPPGSVSLTTALKNYLSEHPEKKRELVEAWVEEAKTSAAFATLVAERIDGKVPQAITGSGGGPVEILVKWDGNGTKITQGTE